MNKYELTNAEINQLSVTGNLNYLNSDISIYHDEDENVYHVCYGKHGSLVVNRQNVLSNRITTVKTIGEIIKLFNNF